MSKNTKITFTKGCAVAKQSAGEILELKTNSGFWPIIGLNDTLLAVLDDCKMVKLYNLLYT